MNDKLNTEYERSFLQNKPWKPILFVILLTTIAVYLVPDENIEELEILSIPSPDTKKTLAQSETNEKKTEPTKITENESFIVSKKDKLSLIPNKTESKEKSSKNLKIKQISEPGLEARLLIREYRINDKSPKALSKIDDAYKKAKKFEKNGRNDDAYLLYFYAARKGHGKSSMELGMRADPAYFTKGGIYSNADLSQAYKWYKNAKKSGSSEADQFLSALYIRVTNRANSGDEKARRTLLQWDIETK